MVKAGDQFAQYPLMKLLFPINKIYTCTEWVSQNFSQISLGPVVSVFLVVLYVSQSKFLAKPFL